MFSMYPKDKPLVYTFRQDDFDIRCLFHKNKIGGLVNVPHRYINTTDDNAPKAARIAPNGDPYTALKFYDFNRYILNHFRILMFL